MKKLVKGIVEFLERGLTPFQWGGMGVLVIDPKIAELKADLRRLERHARQLLYKMERIETAWNAVKKQLGDNGSEISHQLGDVLQGWRKK